MTTKRELKIDKTEALSLGQIALLASEGEAQTTGPRKFAMTIYSGEVLRSGYYGDTYLDVTGFKPARQDIPALWNHWSESVCGSVQSMEVKGGKITFAGVLIAGDKELFPDAARVASLLEQGHPLQCSGRWVPMRTEEVQAGAKASVNGKTITGPATIFREFNCREASFCAMGLDEMTEAMAASLGADNHPKEKKNMNLNLIASLKDIFGADRAIDLCAKAPEAAEVGHFLADIVSEVKTLRASVSDLTAQLADSQTKLAAATKAPVVVIASGDAAQPPQKPVELSAMAEGPAKWEREYNELPHVKAQFESAAIYAHFRGRGGAMPTK